MGYSCSWIHRWLLFIVTTALLPHSIISCSFWLVIGMVSLLPMDIVLAYFYLASNLALGIMSDVCLLTPAYPLLAELLS